MCLMTNRCFISSAPSAGALGCWRGVICQTSLFSTLFLFVHRLVSQFSTPTERERRFVGEEGVSGDWSAKGKRIPSRKSQAAFISLDAVDLRDLFSAILGMFIGRVRKGDLPFLGEDCSATPSSRSDGCDASNTASGHPLNDHSQNPVFVFAFFCSELSRRPARVRECVSHAARSCKMTREPGAPSL